ncbi:uncharacterized protein CLAFUR5_08877 [Fulvia fulva]|uniref:Uncharacterized protein n=1 Tax=Passalora fulva TaxID=5499 RepID=A0A9Q8UTU2_PASFU|nr:uncharacterized protein CLAFUR5_08877 [Fulvia fulva]UJO22180.1 hypothetical protein CLAFUR5_08877 [Fulvia fulva]
MSDTSDEERGQQPTDHLKRNGFPELTTDELMSLTIKSESTQKDLIMIMNISYRDLRRMLRQIHTFLRDEIGDIQEDGPLVWQGEVLCPEGGQPKFWMMDKNKHNSWHLRFILAKCTALWKEFQQPPVHQLANLAEPNDDSTGRRPILDTFHRQVILLKMVKMCIEDMKKNPKLREPETAFKRLAVPKGPQHFESSPRKNKRRKLIKAPKFVNSVLWIVAYNTKDLPRGAGREEAYLNFEDALSDEARDLPLARNADYEPNSLVWEKVKKHINVRMKFGGGNGYFLAQIGDDPPLFFGWG